LGLDGDAEGAVLVLLSGKDCVQGVVEVFVTLHTQKIVVCLLGHGHQKDKDEGRHVREQETHLQERNELGECDQQEEQVVEEFELVVEHFWHEAENVVLLIV
jgi:hypothetical protein